MRFTTTRINLRRTRREFLVTLASGFAALVSACSNPLDRSNDDPDDPTPDSPESTGNSPSIDVADVDSSDIGTRAPSTPTELQRSTADFPEPTASLPLRTPVSPTATPEPSPTPTLHPDQWPTVRTDYAAIVSRRLQVRDISYDDLMRLWTGEINDWGHFGEPAAPEVKRIAVDGQTGPMDWDYSEVPVPFDELEEFFRWNHGSIAFVPRDRVDFRFRTLRINGQNVHRGPGEDYPLFIEQKFDPSVAPVPPLGNQQPPATTMMTFIGDIIFGRYVHQRMAAIGDFSAAFWNIHEELKVADITIGDLECSLSDSFPQPEEQDPQTFMFKTWEITVEGLKMAEIDVLARANNHSFNFGVVGMDDTTRTLDEAGILHFGMGHNLDEARRATVVELNGTTYAFVGYNGISDQWDGATPESAGTAPLVDWVVREDIEREVAAGHVVIPYFHWGVEYVADPTEQQRYFAHLAIESGASLVMGSHPHWVQAVETYNGIPIIYSLGNFIFDQSWSRETQEGMYANIWMQGAKVVEIDLIPILIEDDHRPRRMTLEEARPVLDRVWAATDRIIDG